MVAVAVGGDKEGWGAKVIVEMEIVEETSSFWSRLMSDGIVSLKGDRVPKAEVMCWCLGELSGLDMLVGLVHRGLGVLWKALAHPRRDRMMEFMSARGDLNNLKINNEKMGKKRRFLTLTLVAGGWRRIGFGMGRVAASCVNDMRFQMF